MPRLMHLQLHLLVVLYASTAVLGQLLSLSAAALVVWRTFLAAAVGALLIRWVLRRRVMPPAGRLPALLGVGAVIGLHWLCFFGAVKLANVSICLAGMATITFFTAFTEPWLTGRRVKPFEVALGVLVLGGILLVAGFERGRLGGLLAALAGALLAAVFPVLNRRLILRGDMDPLGMIVWEMVGACGVCLLALPLLDGVDGYRRLLEWRGLDGLWLVVLALVCTVFAHGFQIHLLRHISAYSANLAINFEPVYGILAAAVLFGEHRHLHPGFFAGTATILIANVLHPLLLRRFGGGWAGAGR